MTHADALGIMGHLKVIAYLLICIAGLLVNIAVRLLRRPWEKGGKDR